MEIKAHGNMCIQDLNFSLNEQWGFLFLEMFQITLSIALEWLMLCRLWSVIHCSGYVHSTLCTIHFDRREELGISQDQVIIWMVFVSV